MQPQRPLLASLFVLFLGAGAGVAQTGDTNPLRMIPAEADLVLRIQNPGKLVAVGRKLELIQQVAALAAVKEQLESTANRRLRQLIAHFEKTLGGTWPELVEPLAGGGAALGFKFQGNNDAVAVLVVQGKDEPRVEKFLAALLEVIEGELARSESKDKVKKGDYHGIPGYRIGDGLWLARVGSALVACTKKEAMARVLDLHLGRGGKSISSNKGIADADKILPANALATVWLNMEPIQKSPTGKELYKSPRDNGQLTVLVGQYLDLLGRTPWVAGSLAEAKGGFLLTFRAPRGTEGMGPDRLLHLPPPNQPGSLPLLQPKGVLYSSSFYLDLGKIWSDRGKLFPRVQAEAIANADKGSGRILGGVKMSTLLESAGAHHRLVVVDYGKGPYPREAKTRFPAFAFVTQMRDPDQFSRSMETMLRAGALLATGTFKMKLREETHNGQTLAGYRFDEKAEVKQDVNDIRFNFSPCFARVGNQFLVASTLELGRDLIDRLAAEAKSPVKMHPASARDRYYSTGLADLLRSTQDQLITQTILGQAVPPAEARQQVEELIRLAGKLGTVTSEVRFLDNRFHYDFHIRLGK